MNWYSLGTNYGPVLVFLVLWVFMIRISKRRLTKTAESTEENQKILREILETLKEIRDKK